MAHTKEVTTNELMEFLQQNMLTRAEGLTKEDAKQFATKVDGTAMGKRIDDLAEFLQEHMVTKEDLARELSQYPTKEDLAQELTRFATKEEMEQGFSEIRVRLDGHDEEFKEIRLSIDALHKKVQEDGDMFAKEILQLNEKWEIHDQQIQQLQSA